MPGKLGQGVALPVLITVVVALTALVGYGLSARAAVRSRRRARAVLAAAANVIETPPNPDQPARSQAVADSRSDATAPDAEQPSGPHLPAPPALADPPEPAVASLDPEPDPGTDSALANLDGGLFASTLSGQPGGTDALMPTPRLAVDDVDSEPTDGKPASNGHWFDPTSEPAYPGAAYPLPDGSAPSPDYRVKVDLLTGRYYVRYSPFFTKVAAQLWFRTVRDAQRAGFTPGD